MAAVGGAYTCVPTERVQALPPLAVGGVDIAVPRTSADQDGPTALGTLHEGQIANGAVMHAEFQVRACRGRPSCHCGLLSSASDSLDYADLITLPTAAY